MTKKIIPILLTTLCLTGCFDDKEASLDWCTPELFFSNPDGEFPGKLFCSKYNKNEKSYECYDEDYSIQNAILEVGYFFSVEKREPTNTRSFSYYRLRALATSGPNYAEMTIYADGLLVIDYKSSLSPHYYYYYEFSNEVANNLISIVEKKIETIYSES